MEEPDSLTWARDFIRDFKRLPTALEYAENGYGDGSQCDCEAMGQCPVNSNGKMETRTNRRCYANQLRDFIALSDRNDSLKCGWSECTPQVEGFWFWRPNAQCSHRYVEVVQVYQSDGFMVVNHNGGLMEVSKMTGLWGHRISGLIRSKNENQ